jgi:hypothetical protein
MKRKQYAIITLIPKPGRGPFLASKLFDAAMAAYLGHRLFLRLPASQIQITTDPTFPPAKASPKGVKGVKSVR